MAVDANVGLIGAGLLGSAIAERLLAAGFAVIGYDVDTGCRERLGAIGARAASSARLYLLAPPIVLISLLAAGYSTTYSVIIAIIACPLTAYLRRESRLGLRGWLDALDDIARRASHVAVPIAAIGIIIAVAIRSNLALKSRPG